MIGILIGSSAISFLCMISLMWLSIRNSKVSTRTLPYILCSSAICAISLFSVGVLLL